MWGKLMQSEAVTAEEVAKTLGISKDLVYAGWRSGELPAQRIGHRWIMTRAMLQRFIDGEKPPEQIAS